MELHDLVGRWKKYDKGAMSSTTTTHSFSSNGTYNKFVETSMFIMNPFGSLSNSRTSSENGKFKIIGPLKIELESEEHFRREVSIFSLGSKVV